MSEKIENKKDIKVPSVCIFILLDDEAPITAGFLKSLKEIDYDVTFFKILYQENTKEDAEKVSRLLPNAKMISSKNVVEEIMNAHDDFSIIWSPLITADPKLIKRLMVTALKEAAAVIAPKIVYDEDEVKLFMVDGGVSKDGHYVSSVDENEVDQGQFVGNMTSQWLYPFFCLVRNDAVRASFVENSNSSYWVYELIRNIRKKRGRTVVNTKHNVKVRAKLDIIADEIFPVNSKEVRSRTKYAYSLQTKGSRLLTLLVFFIQNFLVSLGLALNGQTKSGFINFYSSVLVYPKLILNFFSKSLDPTTNFESRIMVLRRLYFSSERELEKENKQGYEWSKIMIFSAVFILTMLGLRGFIAEPQQFGKFFNLENVVSNSIFSPDIIHRPILIINYMLSLLPTGAKGSLVVFISLFAALSSLLVWKTLRVSDVNPIVRNTTALLYIFNPFVFFLVQLGAVPELIFYLTLPIVLFNSLQLLHVKRWTLCRNTLYLAIGLSMLLLIGVIYFLLAMLTFGTVFLFSKNQRKLVYSLISASILAILIWIPYVISVAKNFDRGSLEFVFSSSPLVKDILFLESTNWTKFINLGFFVFLGIGMIFVVKQRSLNLRIFTFTSIFAAISWYILNFTDQLFLSIYVALALVVFALMMSLGHTSKKFFITAFPIMIIIFVIAIANINHGRFGKDEKGWYKFTNGTTLWLGTPNNVLGNPIALPNGVVLSISDGITEVQNIGTRKDEEKVRTLVSKISVGEELEAGKKFSTLGINQIVIPLSPGEVEEEFEIQEIRDYNQELLKTRPQQIQRLYDQLKRQKDLYQLSAPAGLLIFEANDNYAFRGNDTKDYPELFVQIGSWLLVLILFFLLKSRRLLLRYQREEEMSPSDDLNNFELQFSPTLKKSDEVVADALNEEVVSLEDPNQMNLLEKSENPLGNLSEKSINKSAEELMTDDEVNPNE